ncbi:MAG TPA: hypothetical protein VFH33_07370 [Candidatus Krumholzibacteria bacterium]|nr:hypothetical protein [Candidatus Krumholzibacteria bacterium]
MGLKMDEDTPTLDEFVAACDKAFAFLVNDYGFTRLAKPMEFNRYSVRYRKNDLEVDVYGESYGNSTECQLVRGDDRLYLSLLLPLSAQKARPEGQLAQIATIASELQQHVSDFLSGDTKRFDTWLSEWRKRFPKLP